MTHTKTSVIWQLFWALFLIGLTACGKEPEPNPGDPIPNVREGLIALYSGDLAGVDMYFCDEIVLDARRIANQAALGKGRIEFRESKLEIASKQAKQNWTVKLTGEYAIWLYGQADVRNTEAQGAVYIGVKVEDGIWKICAFGSESPTPTP